MSLPAQQIISSPFLAGTPTAPTPPVGDSSALVPTTAFITTAIANAIAAYSSSLAPKVAQGTGIGQLSNQIKIGWSGSQVLVTVDNTNMGNILFGSDYTALSSAISSGDTNLQNQINSDVASLQGQINSANGRPYAYTGIGQGVSFGGLTASGIQDNGDLNVTGTINCNNDIWAFASDARLKENIVPIKDALGKLHEITGVLYNFTAEAHALVGEDAYNPERQHMGVLAQDAKRVAPQVIGPAPFDTDKVTKKSISGENYMTVQYDKLIALVIEAVKELDTKVDALDAKINMLSA